jgi:predicted lysophospholipase L1 biosynthesis ABC-type transport system permease subunit
VIGLDGDAFRNGAVVTVPVAGTPVPERLPMLGVLVATDGRRATMETVRTTIEQVAARTADLPWTTDELKGRSGRQTRQISQLSDTVLVVTLILAGCSLTVSVAGGLVERRRPFALLRLTGMRPAMLRRMLLVETTGPLVIVTVVSVALGLAVAAEAMRAAGRPWVPPRADYWWFLGGGLTASLAIAIGATVPMFQRLTGPAAARFE